MRRSTCMRLALLSAAAGFLVSCSSSSSPSSEPQATLVTVVPSTFGGNVVCADLPGAWRTYIATLVSGSQKVASGPIPCQLPVSFAPPAVVPGNCYGVHIDAYDTARIIDPVAPTWTATCGLTSEWTAACADAGTTGVLARLNTNVVLQDCSKLDPPQYSGRTGVSINLAAMRNVLSCGEGPDEIAQLRVVPVDSPLELKTPPCEVEKVTYENVPADSTLVFRIEAFERNDARAKWATECKADPIVGVTISADCDTLTSLGALRIDTTALLKGQSMTCGQNRIAQIRAELVSSGTPSLLKPCAHDAIFRGLKPSVHQVLADVLDTDGNVRLQAFCEGSVSPGATATATCAVLSVSR